MRDGGSIGLAEARAHLPQLVERAAAGEVIVITRKGKPLAQLVPMPMNAASLEPGELARFAASQDVIDRTIPAGTPLTIDATPSRIVQQPRNAAPRPQTSSRLAPQPAGLTLADILKASR